MNKSLQFNQQSKSEIEEIHVTKTWKVAVTASSYISEKK